MILADKRDFANGYKKHYSAYKDLESRNSSVRSRRLLLTYCVECGLKYLLLDQWHENSPKNIIANQADSRNEVIKSHNLERMLKELGQAGTFAFPKMTTIHQDPISSKNFHELCRYGINIDNNDKAKEELYEIELKKIADWIREGI